MIISAHSGSPWLAIRLAGYSHRFHYSWNDHQLLVNSQCLRRVQIAYLRKRWFQEIDRLLWRMWIFHYLTTIFCCTSGAREVERERMNEWKRDQISIMAYLTVGIWCSCRFFAHIKNAARNSGDNSFFSRSIGGSIKVEFIKRVQNVHSGPCHRRWYFLYKIKLFPWNGCFVQHRRTERNQRLLHKWLERQHCPCKYVYTQMRRNILAIYPVGGSRIRRNGSANWHIMCVLRGTLCAISVGPWYHIYISCIRDHAPLFVSSSSAATGRALLHWKKTFKFQSVTVRRALDIDLWPQKKSSGEKPQCALVYRYYVE